MNFLQSALLITIVIFFNACACAKSYAGELEKKEFPAEKIVNVSIGSISAKIDLTPTKENKIFVKLEGEKPKNVTLLKTDHSGKSLEIEIDRPDDKSLNKKCKKLHLYISLPKKVYNKIETDTVSGDVVAADLSSDDFELESVSGDFNLKNINGDLNIDTVSGDAKINNINPKEEIELESVSGDFELKLNPKLDFSFKFSSVSGDFKSKTDKDFSISSINSTDGKTEFKNGKGTIDIDIETVSGDVELAKN